MRLKKDAFPKHQPNEWVQPRRNGYLLACCDCGLVHEIDFRIVKTPRGNKIRFRARRAEAATRALRKRDGHATP